MEWLNYHHLYYFAVIAEEGGLAAAARKLRLTHSTLSAQLRALEDHFGAPLFERRGKRLVLTSFGADAVNYAAVTDRVVELAQGGPYRLLERLAAVIADDLVARFGVTRARVRVAKPDVPIPHPLAEVAVIAEASAGRNSDV